jgi:excisionase family DNA binding protein
VTAPLAIAPDSVEALVEEVVRRVIARLPPPAQESPYLSVQEAAACLRAPRSRVYDLLSAGRLSRFKDGARVLVSRAEIEAHLAGAMVSPAARRRAATSPAQRGERVSGG